jgi:HKD family nuclease
MQMVPKPTGLVAAVELIVLPYASVDGNSLVRRLITELSSKEWTEARFAVAFGKESGNYPDLVDALVAFATDGSRVDLTFGADAFAGQSKGTDYTAVKLLVDRFEKLPNARVHLYHEGGRTFHPKIYLFANPAQRRARFFVGSSNWSEGGLETNVEANVSVTLDLRRAEHQQCYRQVADLFDQYWTEAQ